jgi:hypothetical protein
MIQQRQMMTNKKFNLTTSASLSSLLLMVLVFCVTTQSVIAQNATVNIKGVVTEESTGKPLGKEMDMVITAPTGKKFVVKVNSATGEYLQPLASGNKYTIAFTSFAAFKKVVELDLPPMTKYKEFTQNYTVREIKQGFELVNTTGFDPGQSTLNAEGSAKMTELFDIMRGNRDLNIIIKINNEEIPKPAVVAPKVEKKVAPTKGKKGAKAEVAPAKVVEPVVSAPTINTALYEQRVQAIKTALAEVKNAELRIQYEQGINVQPSAGVKFITVHVGVVKSAFDE